MSELQHAPGPWWHEGGRAVFASVDGVDVVIAGARLYVVASVDGIDECVKGRARANARLIAAAPCLLSACEAMLTAREVPGGIYMQIAAENRAADLMAAAVAKAKGGGS